MTEDNTTPPAPPVVSDAPAPVTEAPAPEAPAAPVEETEGEARTPNRRLTLVGHNLPHVDPMIVEASFSDLFFNHSHDNWDRAKNGPQGDDDETLRAGLRADAEEFANTLATATGFLLDPDELVADFFARL